MINRTDTISRPVTALLAATTLLSRILVGQPHFNEAFTNPPDYANAWVLAWQSSGSPAAAVTYTAGNFDIQASNSCPGGRSPSNGGVGIGFHGKEAFTGDLDVSFQFNHGGYGRTSVGLWSANLNQRVIGADLDTDDTPYLNLAAGRNSTQYQYSSAPYLDKWITLRIQIVGSTVNFYADDGTGQQLLQTYPVPASSPADTYYIFFGAGSVCWKSGGNDTAFRVITADGATPNGGTITVTASPPEATFVITPPVSGARRSGPYPVSQHVPAGRYVIAFDPINGFITPDAVLVDVTNGVLSTVNAEYKPDSSSRVVTDSSSIAFSWQAGLVGPVKPQSVLVSSVGSNSSFIASAFTGPRAGPWLLVTPASATTPASLSITVSPLLPPGTYTGKINITPTSSGASSIYLPVVLTITPPSAPSLVVSPTSLSFSFQQDAGFIPPQSVTISSLGSTLHVIANDVTSDGNPWLQGGPAQITDTPVEVQVSVSSALPVGTFSGWISLISNAANSGLTIPVTATVAGQQSSTPSGTPSLSIAPAPPKPATGVLGGSNIEYDVQSVLFSVMNQEYRNVLDSYTRASNLGPCYDGIIDAMRSEELKSLTDIPLTLLAESLVTIPLDLIPTETLTGKLLVMFGDYVTSSIVQNETIDTVRFVTEQTAGYVLSQLTNDYISEAALPSIDSNTLLQYFQRDGVTTLRLATSNAGTVYERSQIVPSTAVTGVVMYSPTTDYVVAAVQGACQPFAGQPATTGAFIFRVAAAPSKFLRNASAASDLDVVPIAK